MTFDLTEIHNAVPGYAETLDRLRRLDEIPLPIASALTPVERTAAAVVAALEAGETPDVEALAADALRGVEAVQTALTSIGQARTQLRGKAQYLLNTHADVVLAGLDQALQQLVATVKAEPEETYPDALEAEYAALRSQQLTIVAEKTAGQLPNPPEVLFASNLPEVFTSWAPWRSHGYLLQEGAATDPVVIRPPWPVPSENARELGARLTDSRSRSTFVEDAKTIDWLLWAVEHDVRLWVPTMAQVRAEEARHRALLDRPSRKLPGGLIDPGSQQHADQSRRRGGFIPA